MKHLNADLDLTTNIEVPLTPSNRILGLDGDNNIVEIQGSGGGGDGDDDFVLGDDMDNTLIGQTYCYTAGEPLNECYVIGASVRISQDNTTSYAEGTVVSLDVTTSTTGGSGNTPDCGGWEEGDAISGTYWEWEVVSQTLGQEPWGPGGVYFDHGIDWDWEFPNGVTQWLLFSVNGGQEGVVDGDSSPVNLFVGQKLYGKFGTYAETYNDGNATPIGGTFTSVRLSSEGTTTLRKVRQITTAPAPQKWISRAYLVGNPLNTSTLTIVEEEAVFPSLRGNTVGNNLGTVRYQGDNYVMQNGFMPAGTGITNLTPAVTFDQAHTSTTADDGVYETFSFSQDVPTKRVVCESDGSFNPIGDGTTTSSTTVCVEITNVNADASTNFEFDIVSTNTYTATVTCPADDDGDGDTNADGDIVIDGDTVNCPAITSDITYDGGATLATPTVYADFTTSNFTTQQNNLQEASQDNPGKLPGVLSIQTNNYKNKFNNNTTPAQAAANLITMNGIRAALGQNALNADGSVGAAQAVSTIEVIAINGSTYTVTATVNNGRTLAPLQRFYVGSTKYVIDTVTPNGANFDITVTASVHGTTVAPITVSNTQIPVTDDIVFGRWTSFYGTYFEFEVATVDYYPYNPGFGLDNRYLYLQYAPDVDTEDERNNITGGIGTSGNATVLLNKSLLVAGAASNPIAASGTVMFTVNTADINFPSYVVGGRVEVTVSSAGLTTSFEGNIDSIVPVSGDATKSIITLGNLTLTTDIDTTTSFSVTEIKCADGTGMVIINEDGDTMLGDLFVDGDETVDGDLTVDGDGMFTGDLDGDNIKADGDLDVDGDGHIDGDLDLGGDLGIGDGEIGPKGCSGQVAITVNTDAGTNHIFTLLTGIANDYKVGDSVKFYTTAGVELAVTATLTSDIDTGDTMLGVQPTTGNLTSITAGTLIEICPGTGTVIIDGDGDVDGDVEIDGDGNIDADGDISADGDIMADGDISGGGSLGGSIVPCPENDAAVLNFFNNISTLTIGAAYAGERNLGKFDFLYTGLPSGLTFSDQTFGLNIAFNDLASAADLQGRFIVLRPDADGAWGNSDFGIQQKQFIYSLVKDASNNFVLNKAFPTTPGTYQIAIGNGDFAPGWCVINEFGVAEEVTIGEGTTRLRDGLIASTGGFVIDPNSTTLPEIPTHGLRINGSLNVQAGTAEDDKDVIFQLNNGNDAKFAVQDLNGQSIFEVNDGPGIIIGNTADNYNTPIRVHGATTIGDENVSRNLTVTGTTRLGITSETATSTGQAIGVNDSGDIVTVTGGGVNYTGADNTVPLSNGVDAASGFDASPITVSATATNIDGDLVVSPGGFGVATATTGTTPRNTRVNFDLRTDDAKFEVLDGTSENDSILRAQRLAAGNAVTVGTSANSADLTVHGTVNGNGSGLTNVIAESVNGQNSTQDLKFWSGNRVAYQALVDASTIQSDTIYNITDDNSPGTTTFGGPVTTPSTLTVGALASLNGGVAVDGNATVSGNLSATGTISGATLTQDKGTWTPTLNVAGTLVSSVGTWTRYDDRVIVDFNIVTNSTETGADAVEVNNLPFTNLTQSTGTAYHSSSLGTDIPLTIATGATTTLAVLVTPSGGFLQRSQLFDGGTNRLFGNITYRIS